MIFLLKAREKKNRKLENTYEIKHKNISLLLRNFFSDQLHLSKCNLQSSISTCCHTSSRFSFFKFFVHLFIAFNIHLYISFALCTCVSVRFGCSFSSHFFSSSFLTRYKVTYTPRETHKTTDN